MMEDAYTGRPAGGLQSWATIFEHPAEGPPTLGLNFLSATKDMITIKYALAPFSGASRGSKEKEEGSLILGQDLAALGLGGVVWDCGKALVAFLGQYRQLIQGKRVVDLGTGTGVAGLAAAQCGARDVVLTDYSELESLVRSNIERNSGLSASSVSFVPFNWNKAATQASGLASTDDPVHIVLASDCLYDPSAFPMFKQSLLALCNPRTLVVMAYKRRLDSREKDFFEQLEADFHLELHPHHHPLASSGRPSATSPTVGQTGAHGVYLLTATQRDHRHGSNSSPMASIV